MPPITYVTYVSTTKGSTLYTSESDESIEAKRAVLQEAIDKGKIKKPGQYIVATPTPFLTTTISLYSPLHAWVFVVEKIIPPTSSLRIIDTL